MTCYYRIALIFFFILLLLRLGYLTVVQGRDFRLQAEQNRVIKENIEAARGTIFDRYGELLAVDIPYCLYLDQEKNWEECLKLKSSGGEVEQRFHRYYPLAGAAAHITGYLGEADSTETEVNQYRPGQMVGRGGMEEYYQPLLSGKEGYKLAEVNIKGEKTREVGEVEAQDGRSLTLFVDSRIQEKAFDLLAGRPGAIVVSNPQNGEILALASSPSFDPNLFTFNRNEEVIARLLSDSNQPFLNRAMSARFPPGSIFKLIVGLAALEEGVIDSGTEIEDVGVVKIGDYQYANWYYTQYGKTDGNVNIVEAVKRSNDIFFYRLGELLGGDRIADWAGKFSLDKRLGIDLPAEVFGFVPTPRWKEEVLGEPWFLGNSFHFAIGQGDLAVTPLAINMVTNFFANKEGVFCRPRLANDGSSLNCFEIPSREENRDLILQGMIAACQPGGTASTFFDFKIDDEAGQVACKTGTAEFDIDNKRTHAWFTAFAPAKDPVVSVTVFLQNGGGGAREAAPLAKEILEDFFANR
jgi:penicillin-binding protein 2